MENKEININSLIKTTAKKEKAANSATVSATKPLKSTKAKTTTNKTTTKSTTAKSTKLTKIPTIELTERVLFNDIGKHTYDGKLNIATIQQLKNKGYLIIDHLHWDEQARDFVGIQRPEVQKHVLKLIKKFASNNFDTNSDNILLSIRNGNIKSEKNTLMLELTKGTNNSSALSLLDGQQRLAALSALCSCFEELIVEYQAKQHKMKLREKPAELKKIQNAVKKVLLADGVIVPQDDQLTIDNLNKKLQNYLNGQMACVFKNDLSLSEELEQFDIRNDHEPLSPDVKSVIRSQNAAQNTPEKISLRLYNDLKNDTNSMWSYIFNDINSKNRFLTYSSFRRNVIIQSTLIQKHLDYYRANYDSQATYTDAYDDLKRNYVDFFNALKETLPNCLNEATIKDYNLARNYPHRTFSHLLYKILDSQNSNMQMMLTKDFYRKCFKGLQNSNDEDVQEYMSEAYYLKGGKAASTDVIRDRVMWTELEKVIAKIK